MRQMIRRGIFWAGLALVALYWPIAYLVPAEVLGDVLRVIQIVSSLIVISAYAPWGLDGIRRGRPDRGEQLALAITIGFAAIALNGLWFLVWRLSDRPPWMPDSFVNGFTLWLGAIACLLYISAASALKGTVPNRNTVLISAAFGAGVVVAVIALLAVPDLREELEALRPYLHR